METTKKSEFKNTRIFSGYFIDCFRTKWINNGKEMIEIEEVKLASGEMQSKPKSNAFETLLKQVAKEQEKMKQKDENEDKKHVNLDPRSDLSSADEMMDELVEAVARKSKVSTCHWHLTLVGF